MFCATCGAEVPDGTKFCGKCGAAMGTGAPRMRAPGFDEIAQGDAVNADGYGTPAEVEQSGTGYGGVEGYTDAGSAMNDIPDVGAGDVSGAAYTDSGAEYAATGTGYAAQPQSDGADMTAGSQARRKRHSFRWILVLVILLLLVIVGEIGLHLYRQATAINLSEYIHVTVDGYEGYGTADVEIDEAGLSSALKGIEAWPTVIKIIGGNGELADALGVNSSSNIRSRDVVDAICDLAYDGELDKARRISTGDAVSYVIALDGASERVLQYGLSRVITIGEIRTEASALEPIEEIDPFENVEISCEGYDGHGELSATETGSESLTERYGYAFVYEDTGDLANGDTVTITIESERYDSLDDYAANEGIVLTQSEMEYTVEGLEEAAAVDPFENLEVQYDGFSPNLTISINEGLLTEPVKGNVQFTVEGGQTSGYAVGDTFTVKATPKTTFTSDGYVLSAREQEYTITEDDVSKYLEATDSYDLSALNQQFDDYVEAQMNSHMGEWLWNTPFEVEGLFEEYGSAQAYLNSVDQIQCVQTYLACIKDEYENEISGNDTDGNRNEVQRNRYFRLYRIDYTATTSENGGGKASSKVTYVLLYGDDVAHNADGSFVWAGKDNSVGREIYTDSQINDYDQVVARNVTSMKENYNVTEISQE